MCIHIYIYTTNLKMQCSAMISDDSPNGWSTFDYERVLEVLKSLHPNISGLCYHMCDGYNHIFDGQITICIKNKKQQPLKDSKTWQTNDLLVVHSFTFHSVLITAINSEDPNASAGALPATAIPFPSADSTPKWQVLVDFLVTSWDFWRFPKLWVPPSHSFSHWLYKSIAFPVD